VQPMPVAQTPENPKTGDEKSGGLLASTYKGQGT